MGDVQVGLAVGGVAVGFVVWLIRLEGRVNTNEALQKALTDDVKYIRERIDRALSDRE